MVVIRMHIYEKRTGTPLVRVWAALPDHGSHISELPVPISGLEALSALYLVPENPGPGKARLAID